MKLLLDCANIVAESVPFAIVALVCIVTWENNGAGWGVAAVVGASLGTGYATWRFPLRRQSRGTDLTSTSFSVTLR